MHARGDVDVGVGDPHNIAMSHHRSSLHWERRGLPFTYESYSRDHRVSLETGLVMQASAAADYRGNPTLPNPEELLVAALSSCHMLTFLAICARKGIVVERYDDEAVGVLERADGKPTSVTHCTLHPRTEFGEGKIPTPEELHSLHEQAHRGCFIASSVKTVVTFELG